MEPLEKILLGHNIESPSFTWLPDDEESTKHGTMTGKKTKKFGGFFEFFCPLYVGDGAFMFALNEDTIQDTCLHHIHLQLCFGMSMHVEQMQLNLAKAASPS